MPASCAASLAIQGGAWVQQVLARGEREQRRTQGIVRLMMPEILRMRVEGARQQLAQMTERAKAEAK